MAQTSPPKPWQMRQSGGSTSSSSLRVSSSVANGRAVIPSDGNIGTPSSLTASSATNLPHIPQRPLSNSAPSAYGQRYGSSYDRYGGGYGNSSYGGGYGNSSYGGSTYGSSYGGYGNSSYGGGYGRYGRYGNSSYGGGYGGYGNSSYGGYGRYGNNSYGGGYDQDRPRDGYFQSTIDGGANQINKFGQMVEGISMFSRLLDANFDAMHGSFSSVLRLLDVFGEFYYVVKTFALFRGLAAILNWVLGRKITPSIRIENGKNSVVSAEEYSKFASNQRKQKMMPFLLLVLGCTCIGLPIFLLRVWRKFSERLRQSDHLAKLDTVWQEDPAAGEKPVVDFSKPTLVKAIFDFIGNDRMELNFKQNDIIKLIAKPFPEWWEGEFNGQRGLFPYNYVQPFETSSELPTSKKDV